MSNNFQSRLTESLQEENDFIKMKLMLEKGAKFSSCEGAPPLPAHIENMFLKNIMAIEDMAENGKEISVYEKIGKPTHFRPIEALMENEIESAWLELHDLFLSKGIQVIVFSPNTTSKDLYRFATTELYDIMIEDFDLPGAVYNFIYDDFHPDPVYESSRIATEECMTGIFNTRVFDEPYFFSWFGLQLNEHRGMLLYEFGEKINNFKQAYDDIKIVSLQENNCEINDSISIVEGTYTLKLMIDHEEQLVKGKWSVTLECKENLQYWYVKKVWVEGIRF